MTSQTEEILKEALNLSPVERTDLIDRLIVSLDKPDEEIDKIWKQEITSRVKAYEEGKLETVSLDDVLSKYKK